MPGEKQESTVECYKPTIQIWEDWTHDLLRMLRAMKVDKRRGRKSKLSEILVWNITSYGIVLNYKYISSSVLRNAQIEMSLLYILNDCCPLLAACWCRLKIHRSLCIILAGLPGVARAFTTLKYCVCPPPPPPPPPPPSPGAPPKFLTPPRPCPGSSLTYLAKFQLCILKTVRMHRDRQTDRQRQRQTILFIDIDKYSSSISGFI